MSDLQSRNLGSWYCGRKSWPGLPYKPLQPGHNVDPASPMEWFWDIWTCRAQVPTLMLWSYWILSFGCKCHIYRGPTGVNERLVQGCHASLPILQDPRNWAYPLRWKPWRPFPKERLAHTTLVQDCLHQRQVYCDLKPFWKMTHDQCQNSRLCHPWHAQRKCWWYYLDWRYWASDICLEMDLCL